MEPFDLGLRLAEAGALGCERAHQLLQRLHIIRQGGKIDVHDGESLADSRRSRRIYLRHRVNRPQRHPAIAGRHRCSGARQSTPSISIDSCAEVNDSVSPGSTLGGHRKTPCSSRLVNRQSPVPSQKMILIRLALATPEHEQVARERILPQHALHQHRETVDALAHVDVAQSQVHLHARREQSVMTRASSALEWPHR